MTSEARILSICAAGKAGQNKLRKELNRVWKMARTVCLALLMLMASSCLAQGIQFIEVSEAAGLNGRDWMDTWRPENNRYFGATVFDGNDDGYLDLVLPNHSDNTEFYFGSPTGFKFVDTRTKRWDVHSSAAYDWDEDGDLDFLVVRGGRDGSRPNPAIVCEMDGDNSTFKMVSEKSIGLDGGIRGRALSFLDIDGDGDGDLLLVNRHSSGQAKAHFIYENEGKGNFVKHTSVGFEETVAAWYCLVDLNNDSFLDIILMGFRHVEVWMGTGTFTYKMENWRLPDAEKLRAARACAEIDVDNDGKMEIYIARGDEQFSVDDKLYKVQNGRLVDISRTWNVPRGGRHSHVTVLDANNDGRMDLYVSVKSWYMGPRVPDMLLYNTGTRLTISNLKATGLRTPYNLDEDGDNAIAFDYNNDGWVDLLVGLRNAPWRLYENRTPANGNNWVRIAVGRSRAGVFNQSWDKNPWGALVTIKCGRTIFTQRTGSPGMSHSSSNIMRLTFGIGTCTKVTRIRTRYIGGLTTYRWGGKVNREITVGLMHCPGIHCNKKIPRCRSRCSAKVCERNTMSGKTLYCEV